jgi:hypothetical protein
MAFTAVAQRDARRQVEGQGDRRKLRQVLDGQLRGALLD